MTGYIGASCNIDGTIAPNITSFAPRSRCNIQEQNCTSVMVRAETLTNLLDLTCSISLVEVNCQPNDCSYFKPIYIAIL